MLNLFANGVLKSRIIMNQVKTNVTKNYVDDSINELKSSLLQEIQKEWGHMKSSVIDNLLDENARLKERVLHLEDEVNYFQFEIEHLHERVHGMETDAHAYQQQWRQNNVELVGLPFHICDDHLEATCVGILNHLVDVDIVLTEIDTCYRLQSEENMESSNVTVIRFACKRRVDEIKKNKDILNSIDLSNFDISDDCKLYVNDNLSPGYQSILYHCKKLRREGKINKLITEGGEIQIKLLNGQCWHTIRNEQMLKDLFPDFEGSL